MSTTLNDLRRVNRASGQRAHVPATVADLVAALIAEGGEIVDVGYDGRELTTGSQVLDLGRYLVFPIPVESAEDGQSPEVPT